MNFNLHKCSLSLKNEITTLAPYRQMGAFNWGLADVAILFLLEPVL